MKKLFLFFVAAVFAVAVNAQSSMTEQMSNIEKLTVKLQKAIEKAPKASGVADVDAYTDGCKAAAIGAVASAEKLQNLYKREIGESVDGVTEVTESKPTQQDWIELGSALATQVAGTAELGAAGAKASQAVKDAPKMKAIGMAKSVKWSSDILPVITEALAEEGKAVKQIIETLQSGSNL